MKIQDRTLISLIVILTLFSVCVFFLFRYSMTDIAHESEENFLAAQLTHFENNILRSENDAASIVNQVLNNKELSDFVADPFRNAANEEMLLPKEKLEKYLLEFGILFDNQKNIVYKTFGKMKITENMDGTYGYIKDEIIPEDFLKFLEIFYDDVAPHKKVKVGFVRFNNQVYEIIASGIYDEKDVRVGMGILGYEFTEAHAELADLGYSDSLALLVKSPYSSSYYTENIHIEEMLNRVVGYKLIRDYWNNPTLALRMQIKQSVLNAAFGNLQNSIIELYILLIFFILFILIFQYLWIVGPINLLTEFFTKYSLQEYRTARFNRNIFGREMNQLSHHINEILDKKEENALLLQNKNKQNKEQLQNYSLQAEAIDSLKDEVIICDLEGSIIYANQATEKRFGLSIEEIINRKYKELYYYEKKYEESYAYIVEKLFEQSKWHGGTEYVVDDGTVYYDTTAIKIKSLRNNIEYIVVYNQDITDKMNKHIRLKRLANFDELTAMPKHAKFMSDLEEFIAHNPDKMAAVFFIDVDKFKKINKLYGNKVGDELLIQFSSRIRDALPHANCISRRHGNDFNIFQEIHNIEQATIIACQILSATHKEFYIMGMPSSMSVNIGVSIFPRDGYDADLLVKSAGLAMQDAKQKGKNCYTIFSNEMLELRNEREKIGNVLKDAFYNNKLTVVYDPIYDVNLKTIVYVEPMFGILYENKSVRMPEHFIKIADETGLMSEMLTWLIEKACMELAKWHEKGISVKLNIRVYLSFMQHPNFISLLNKIVMKNNIQSKDINIEIDENDLFRDTVWLMGIFQKLDEIGMTTTLSNFGLLQTSLSNIQKLNVLSILISPSYIENLLVNTDSQKIVSTIMEIGKTMNLRIVSEAVDTKAQFEYLKKAGILAMQGSYISEPLTGEDCYHVLLNTQNNGGMFLC